MLPPRKRGWPLSDVDEEDSVLIVFVSPVTYVYAPTGFPINSSRASLKTSQTVS